MRKILSYIFLLTCLISCATTTLDSKKFDEVQNIEDILSYAEDHSTEHGKRILLTSRDMISNQEVFVGGCWDYINEVYNRAGYPSKRRETAYKSKYKGPYVKSDNIQTGDWLYFVNHSYRDIEHSAIFVAWIDRDTKEALMVNYVGGNKKQPATYKRFILDKVYNIFRARD